MWTSIGGIFEKLIIYIKDICQAILEIWYGEIRGIENSWVIFITNLNVNNIEFSIRNYSYDYLNLSKNQMIKSIPKKGNQLNALIYFFTSSKGFYIQDHLIFYK